MYDEFVRKLFISKQKKPITCYTERQVNNIFLIHDYNVVKAKECIRYKANEKSRNSA